MKNNELNPRRRSFLGATALAATSGAALALGGCATAAGSGGSRLLAIAEVPAGKAAKVTSADGTKISVNEYGNPAGRPILLVHGFTQSRLSWTRQFTDPALAARYRIVAMDLRGHGESDKPAGPYTPKLQAEDVHAVVTSLGLVKPVAVGWSLGGVVVLDYLAHYGVGSVSKVLFVDAGYGRSSDPKAPATSGPGLLANMPLMLNDDAAVNGRGTLAFLQACTHAPLPPADLAFALSYNMLATPASRRATIAGRRGAPEDYERNVMPALRAAGVPVIAMTGARDTIVLPSAAGDIARATGGKVVEYPDVGHIPFMEATARFNADLAAFAA